MSTIRSIAKHIPDRVRSELLLTSADPIAKAVPVSANPAMRLLFEIWFEFIEPNRAGDLGCSVCLGNVLSNFRSMKQDLIDLEKESNLLKSIK